MPSVREIVDLAVRTVTVKVCGLDITITENLMRDPGEQKAARARLQESIDRYAQIVERGREASANKDDDAAAVLSLEGQLMQLKAVAAADAREIAARSISRRVKSWDLTEDDGHPVSLDFEKLRDGSIPTELFEEILTGLDKEPLVPKASN